MQRSICRKVSFVRQSSYLFGDEGYMILRGMSQGNCLALVQYGGFLGRDIVCVIFRLLLAILVQAQRSILKQAECSRTTKVRMELIKV